MFCKNCGTKLDDGVQNCPNCGAPQGNAFQQASNFVGNVANKIDQETDRVINDLSGNNYQNRGVARLLKTNRSLIVYILLTFITCGLYNLFFIHSMAKDVNEACANDSERTPGVGMFILVYIISIFAAFVVPSIFSGIGVASMDPDELMYLIQAGRIDTIIGRYFNPGSLIVSSVIGVISGAYPLYWRYKLGNKLQRNGQNYGILITENGSSVLIWDIIGIVCCCLGSYYALYVLIKNTNQICSAYNNKYVYRN